MRFLTLLFLALLCFSCDKGRTPEEQLNAEIADIEDFLDDNGLTAQSTSTGLHYIITEPGSGGHPALSNNVTVRYVGKFLKSGDVFDQTNGTETRTFLLNNLIEGWKEGIPLLEKGGKGTFFIPSALAYGPYGKGSIPGNTTLIFDIELVDF